MTRKLIILASILVAGCPVWHDLGKRCDADAGCGGRASCRDAGHDAGGICAQDCTEDKQCDGYAPGIGVVCRGGKCVSI